MPKQAERLTDADLRSLNPGEWRADGAVPGLLARAHHSGVTFTYRYAIGGQRKTMVIGELLHLAKPVKKEAQPKHDAGTMAAKIAAGINPAELIEIVWKHGETPIMTLAEARIVATALRVKMMAGEDPAAERHADWRKLTLEDAWALYSDSGRERSERTVEEGRALLDRYFPDWLKRPVASVTALEVHQRHRNIGTLKAPRRKMEEGKKRGPNWKGGGRYAADNAMRMFRAIYRRARKVYPQLPAPPTDAVDYYNDGKRKDSAIPPDALAQWWRETWALENDVRRDLYILMLFTGLRRESACTVRVEDVNLEKGTLHIPKPKGGEERAFTLPLSSLLVELLRARIAGNPVWLERANKSRQRRGKAPLPPSPWVFPAHSASGHVEEPKPSAGEYTVKLGNGKEWHPHALRHTYASVATHRAKVHPYALKMLLNHALPEGDVTMGYVHVDLEALRKDQERITAAMLALCEPPEVKALPAPPLALPAPESAAA